MTGTPPPVGKPRTVEILLAAHNGVEFLGEQIDSLFRQTYRDWRVLVRDDGSTDGTREVLSRYATRHPDRFMLMTDDDGNLGYVGNFGRLLQRSTADVLAFCDQDDVWLPNKLAVCVDRLKTLERRHGASTPLLIHSDLSVVDRRLSAIHPSFWRYRGIDAHQGDSLNRLLTQNVATGCTIVLNRPLADLCLPIPEQAAAHDWWVSLVAGAFGKIDAIGEPTTLYRQHAGNTTGARSFLPGDLIRRTRDVFTDFAGHRRDLNAAYQQARAFLERFSALLNDDQRRLIAEFSAFPKLSPLALAYRAIKWRVIPVRRAYWLAFAILAGIVRAWPASSPGERSRDVDPASRLTAAPPNGARPISRRNCRPPSVAPAAERRSGAHRSR